MNTSTVPTWASETSKSHKRGKMVMIEGAMITGGICLSYWIDFGFSYLEPSSVSWRLPIAVQILLALLLMVFILELPESRKLASFLPSWWANNLQLAGSSSKAEIARPSPSSQH